MDKFKIKFSEVKIYSNINPLENNRIKFLSANKHERKTKINQKIEKKGTIGCD